jgi:hypothetical protein
MAVAVTLVVAPAVPNHGDSVVAQYVVAGNDAVPPVDETVDGQATVGAEDFAVSAPVTLPGVDKLPEVFAVPIAAGLVFEATVDPTKFVALVP